MKGMDGIRNGYKDLDQWFWINVSGITNSARLAITWSGDKYRLVQECKCTDLEYIEVHLRVATV